MFRAAVVITNNWATVLGAFACPDHMLVAACSRLVSTFRPAEPIGFCPRLVVLQEYVAGTCLACAGQPCDIEIKGADENRAGNIPWGIDGVYKLLGCYARYPVYKREGKTRLRASLPLFHPRPGKRCCEHAGRHSALACKHDLLHANCLHVCNSSSIVLHHGHATNCPFCRSTAMYLR